MATQEKEKQDFRETVSARSSNTMASMEYHSRRFKVQSKELRRMQRVHRFLTDPFYLGDEHYPIGVESDPDLSCEHRRHRFNFLH